MWDKFVCNVFSKISRTVAEARVLAPGVRENKEKDFAATRLQSMHRARRSRQRVMILREQREQHRAALRLQAVHRGNLARRELAEQTAAATKVQAVTRGKQERQRLQTEQELQQKL